MRRQEFCCKECGLKAMAEFPDRADIATQMKALKEAHAAGSITMCTATVAKFVLRTSTWSDDAWSAFVSTVRNNICRATKAKRAKGAA